MADFLKHFVPLQFRIYFRLDLLKDVEYQVRCYSIIVICFYNSLLTDITIFVKNIKSQLKMCGNYCTSLLIDLARVFVETNAYFQKQFLVRSNWDSNPALLFFLDLFGLPDMINDLKA